MWKFWRKKPKVEERTEPLVAVIDDEVDLCHLLRVALDAQGYQVQTATDGQSGLELIRSCRPDLVLLDIKMPRINGFQVLARLQEDSGTSDIPVIVMTSLTAGEDPSQLEWARRLNVKAFIEKPFDPEQVVELVKKTLPKN